MQKIKILGRSRLSTIIKFKKKIIAIVKNLVLLVINVIKKIQIQILK